MMQPSRQLREALSWKLVSELHRRHPGKFTVIETHPGGGQYDCLTLWSNNRGIADLNRVGSFNSDGCQIPWDELWPSGLTDGGIADVLNRMSRACGFSVPLKLPSTGPETLIYRIMAGVSTTLVFEKDLWEWRNGKEDTSGCGDQTYRDRWFDLFPDAKEAARTVLPGQPFGNPKYDFWFLLKNDKPKLCISKAGRCWDTNEGEIDLAELYHQDRRIQKQVGIVLGLIR